MKYELERTMLFTKDRQIMTKPIIIESINTGTQWRLNPDEVNQFMLGSNRNFYRTYHIQ